MSNIFRTYLISLCPLIYILFISLFSKNIINPLSYLIISSGHIIVIFLILIIIIPLLNSSLKIIDRRSLGLVTFGYAVFHLLLYMIDNSFDFNFLVYEILHLSYIQIGYIGVLLFIPLVFTSNDNIKKRLGDKWAIIHKLIYIIILVSFIHYYLIIKADYYLISLYILIFIMVFFLKTMRHLK